LNKISNWKKIKKKPEKNRKQKVKKYCRKKWENKIHKAYLPDIKNKYVQKS